MASETALLSAALSSHSLLFLLQLHSDTCFVITHRNHHQPKQNQKTSLCHYCQTNDGHHTEMRDHRILEWSRLQRTTMLIQFQPLLCAGHKPAAQAAQSHIQPGLECLQGWGINSLLGQPVPVPHHPLVKNFFLMEEDDGLR